MATRAVDLVLNTSTGSPTTATEWMGGRTCLVTLASSYPTTCQLQLLGKDNATWINIGSNITANGSVSQDLPAGTYRMNLTGGTTTALYATLVSVPYY